jgi:hypothetical protein
MCGSYHLNSNPFCLLPNTSGHEELDVIGTLLWNGCAELMSHVQHCKRKSPHFAEQQCILRIVTARDHQLGAAVVLSVAKYIGSRGTGCDRDIALERLRRADDLARSQIRSPQNISETINNLGDQARQPCSALQTQEPSLCVCSAEHGCLA